MYRLIISWFLHQTRIRINCWGISLTTEFVGDVESFNGLQFYHIYSLIGDLLGFIDFLLFIYYFWRIDYRLLMSLYVSVNVFAEWSASFAADLFDWDTLGYVLFVCITRLNHLIVVVMWTVGCVWQFWMYRGIFLHFVLVQETIFVNSSTKFSDVLLYHD